MVILSKKLLPLRQKLLTIMSSQFLLPQHVLYRITIHFSLLLYDTPESHSENLPLNLYTSKDFIYSYILYILLYTSIYSYILPLNSICTIRINGTPVPRERYKRFAPTVRYPFLRLFIGSKFLMFFPFISKRYEARLCVGMIGKDIIPGIDRYLRYQKY